MTEQENGFRRLNITVRGRVQNVGFRAYVQQIGNHFNLTGWVRNVGNHQVEIVAEGIDIQLNRFSAAVKNGPPGSRVDQITEEKLHGTHEFSKFSIRSSI